jgi:hypothetical protein
MQHVEVVFANIARCQTSGITIGITDSYPKYSQSACISHEFWEKSEKPSYGWSKLMRTVESGLPLEEPHPGWEVLQFLISMSINAGCKVNCIETRAVGYNLRTDGHLDVEHYVGEVVDFHLISGCPIRTVFGNETTKKNQRPFTTVTYSRDTDIKVLERLHKDDHFLSEGWVRDLGLRLQWYEGVGEFPLMGWHWQPDLLRIVGDDDDGANEVHYGEGLGLRWIRPQEE